MLIGEVGAAAVGLATTLDDLSAIDEAPAVCAMHFHAGALSHGVPLAGGEVGLSLAVSATTTLPAPITTKTADHPIAPAVPASQGAPDHGTDLDLDPCAAVILRVQPDHR